MFPVQKIPFAVVPHKYTFDDITLNDLFIVVWHDTLQA
jgi:hypothetical protein